ncbi:MULTISPECIES: SAM-dependent methyltransferase [unclassified Acinetobacter]|uniref:SAM-dependent methyltransferase n=1 Tax=unclassified Acinetobacter TaxID=196816 RepID=UPI0035B9A35E
MQESRLFQPHFLSPPRHFQAIPEQPICLEIGAGKGKHAHLFANENPDFILYAVERTQEKFDAMQKQQHIQPLANLHLVHADAIAWTVHAIYPKQIQRLFLLYPNPEPHNATQRWLNMPFFEYLLSRIADGGEIVLASNIVEYLDEAQIRLQEVWQLPYQRRTIEATSARTHFEIKYLERGEHCQELIIQKPTGYVTRFDDVQPRLGQAAQR